ncbi:hypothetical protein FQN54_000168 [Arachnomyces sp. PD_36]|nr:hypothetical protein FQN54_000168 [Arachnomyces sp. PD_36]
MSSVTATEGPKGSFKLVTVNTAPERAFRLIGRVIEALKERYTIMHVANCDEISEVESKVKEFQPDVLCCASMWTPQEAAEIQSVAKECRPGLGTYAIPQGLQVEKGPDAIVEHLVEKLPVLLDSLEK